MHALRDLAAHLQRQQQGYYCGSMSHALKQAYSWCFGVTQGSVLGLHWLGRKLSERRWLLGGVLNQIGLTLGLVSSKAGRSESCVINTCLVWPSWVAMETDEPVGMK